MVTYAMSTVIMFHVPKAMRRRDAASQHPRFVRCLQEVFKRREEWTICLQAQLPTRGNHTNNYVESAMKVVKEKVLHRLEAYSVTQSVDSVVTRIEAHYIRRLTDVANNRLRPPLKKVLETEDIRRDSIVQVHYCGMQMYS